MQKKILFHINQNVNGVVVLYIEEAKNIQNQTYTVVHHCCGSKTVYAHKNMVRRATNKTDLCASCAAKESLRAVHESRQSEKEKPAPIQTYVPGWGYTLGRMGKSRVCEYGEIHETGGKLNEDKKMC